MAKKSKAIFKAKAQCSSCGGTGLYKGMAEKDGSAVVCYTCKGTGCEDINISYTPFSKKKTIRRVKRVFRDSCGYMHAPDDVTTKEGITIKFSEGGCTYKEWLNGESPKPVKDLYCPYLWTRQGLQSKDVGGLYKDRCNKCGLLGSYISDCKFWGDKATCWEIYEKGGGQ
jgi:hypothetical protein